MKNTRSAAYRAAVSFLRRVKVYYVPAETLERFANHLQEGRLIVARDFGDAVTFHLH